MYIDYTRTGSTPTDACVSQGTCFCMPQGELPLCLHPQQCASPLYALSFHLYAIAGGGVCFCMPEREVAVPLQGSLSAAADGHAESQE